MKKEPNFTLKFINSKKEINEDKIINEIKSNIITTYRKYAIVLNEESQAEVSTLQEANKIVADIKEKYNKDLELDLGIREIFSDDSVIVNEFAVASAELEKLVDIKVKENKATVNGVLLKIPINSNNITSRYAEVSRRRFSAHTGVDIAVKKGTKIKACSEGIVTCAKYQGSYGNLIKIEHGNGVETWYAHCNTINVKVGQKVNTETVIGTVGSTGNSTGAHLHLEVRINGEHVNPQKYIYN